MHDRLLGQPNTRLIGLLVGLLGVQRLALRTAAAVAALVMAARLLF